MTMSQAPDLSISIGSSRFANPVNVASGTFAHAERYYSLEEVKRLGAITPKTVTLRAQEGNPPARIVETPSGMLNAIGIENPGADKFIQDKLPPLKTIGVPLIMSFLGHTPEEFLSLCEKFNAVDGIHAYELNLSCPNLGHTTLVAQDPDATHSLVRRIKSMTGVPVIAKLSPNVTDIVEIAQAAKDAGADGVSLINTMTAMVVDVEKRRSKLGNVTGGLSGPAIRPVGVHMVHRVHKHVGIPIIAMGGIMTARDALEYLIAGATMVSVGTANFINPRCSLEVLDGIAEYLERHSLNSVKDLIGSLQTD